MIVAIWLLAFIAPFLLVPVIACLVRLETWTDIKRQFRNDKAHFLIKVKNYFVEKTGFNYRLYLLLAIYTLYGFADYRDWWSRVLSDELAGTGIIGNNPQNLILYITFLAIVAYTVETYRLRDITYAASEEAAKANELQLRPYLSLHWDSSFKSGNRRGEQVTDTCLLARNDGEGLMRKVIYNVEVNGQEVLVRGHNTITSGRHGTAVVYSAKNINALLGDRNDRAKETNNNELISEGIQNAKIWGEFEDVNGTKYEYCFVRDENEQSWFREEFQRRKPSV